jgi:hypothetical protein
VALYAEIRRNGAENVRVVIGKRHIYASVTHAWLEWETNEGSYVLDPTFNEMPIKTAELDPMTYVPFYAYDGEHKYRAADAGFVAPPARVAAGYSNHFYVPVDARSTFAQPGLIQGGSGQSFSATTEHATLSTRRPRPHTQCPSSNAQRSPPYVKGLRQIGLPATASNAKYMIHGQPRAALTQKRPTPNVRHFRQSDGFVPGRTASNAARLRQVRSLVTSRNGRYVIQMQPRQLPPRL